MDGTGIGSCPMAAFWYKTVRIALQVHNTDVADNDLNVQGGSNMTGTDLYVNKPHCAAAVRP